MKKTGEDNWDKVLKQLHKLNDYQVAVGFFGSQQSKLLTVVRANENGAYIVPHNKSGYLWVPSKAVPKDSDGLPMSAKQIQQSVGGLFVPKGKHVACRNEGGKLVIYFYLLKHVRIPARPFMETALIQHTNKYRRIIFAGLDHILYDGWTARKLLNQLGATAVADMRNSAIKWEKPQNAPLTVALKRKHSNDPLVDTGKMIQKITYKIIPV